MKKLTLSFIVLLMTSSLLFSKDIIVMKGSSKIEAGGALTAMAVGLIILIIGGILKALNSGFKKIDGKVDQLKLERNPNNLKVLEKEFFRKSKMEFSDYKAIVDRIYAIDKNNIIPNSTIGIFLYEKGEFGQSKSYLKSTYYNITKKNAVGLMKNRHFTNSYFEIFKKEYVCKAINYYAELVSMEGDNDEAKKIRRKARWY